MQLRKYPSLRHEAASLQAIRITHFVVPEHQLSWNDTMSSRSGYWQGLMSGWSSLQPYCLMSAEVEKFFLFNPTDLGRWVGGGPFAVPIDGYRRSYLLPAAFVLTACGGTEIDSYLRDYLSNEIADNEDYEAMSWVGFRPKDHDLYSDSSEGQHVSNLESAFRRSGGFPGGKFVALILFQCRVPKNLDKIETVFKHLDDLCIGECPNRVSWRPTIVGLLKGNVDAFALLEGNPPDRPEKDALRDFDELVFHLESQQTGTDFWDGIRPVALYGGKEAHWVKENWDLLDPLPLPQKAQPEPDAAAHPTSPLKPEDRSSAPQPLAS